MVEAAGKNPGGRDLAGRNLAGRDLAGRNLAFLGLGSNIDAERNLPAAVEVLREYGEVARASQVWQSAPVGFAHQADFLNAAVLLRTDCSLAELRQQVVPDVERRLHRQRDPKNKNGPRTIDVDVCLFNREVHAEDGFRVPDADILERLFLARSLAELDPDYVHPETGSTLAQIAQQLAATCAPLVLREDVKLNVGVSQREAG